MKAPPGTMAGGDSMLLRRSAAGLARAYEEDPPRDDPSADGPRHRDTRRGGDAGQPEAAGGRALAGSSAEGVPARAGRRVDPVGGARSPAGDEGHAERLPPPRPPDPFPPLGA